ncbi:hypothetical protein ACE193_02915 [Bernardetia sp. OM2101]|uniref:hypothetical protein n=1 Tax=Bernardetia sp. OM2101 TaxID=3344876 RepID=UPI0035D060CD
MNTNAIYSFRVNRNNETGISVQYFDKNITKGSFQISLDSSPQITVIQIEDVTLLEKVTNEEYFKRLLRDIRSQDTYTRDAAAFILSGFIEFSSNTIDFDIIKEGIEIVIAQISVEKQYEIAHYLAASIFEYIWLEKLTSQEERQFIIRLSNIDADNLYGYLNNDDEYLEIPEVQAYIERTEKRWSEQNKP